MYLFVDLVMLVSLPKKVFVFKASQVSFHSSPKLKRENIANVGFLELMLINVF